MMCEYCGYSEWEPEDLPTPFELAQEPPPRQQSNTIVDVSDDPWVNPLTDKYDPPF